MIDNLDFNNFEDFETASYTVLDFLQKNVGFSLWMMTKTVGNDWIVLQVKDNYYNVNEGDVFKWCDSFCSKMVLGDGPFVAPNSNDFEIYKTSEIAKYVEINSYFGIPIKNKDGSLYGTLCAIDPRPQDEDIIKHLPLVKMLGKLLASMLVQNDLNAELKNKNTKLQEIKVQMIEQYKLASMGEMIGNIAHQWRQPLSMIRTISTGLKVQKELGTLDDTYLIQQLDNIDKSTTYLSDTIEVFRDFLNIDKTYENASLQSIVNESIDILSLMLKDNNIEIIKDYEQTDIQTSILKKELPQVIINIITNTKDAILEKNITNAWIKVTIKKENNKALIIIEDNAKGIPKEVMNRIFEPYFTTKHSSIGTGLGLHMSYKIVTESLEGSISAQNSSDGAVFTISIPI